MIPVFVISLPEATDRRTDITKKLTALGLPFEFFDAVDGRGFDVRHHPNYSGLKRRLCFGKDMTGGELGCTLSHLRVMEKIARENMPYALVLEDDVVLKEDFPAVLKSLLRHDYRWRMVRFLGSPKVARLRQRKIADLGNGYALTRLATSPGGSHAYLITAEAAAVMARHLQKNAYPIDVAMGRPWKTGLPMFTVQPGLAVQDLSYVNSIGDDRFKKGRLLKGWEALAYPFTRASLKLFEAIMKRACYYAPCFSDRKFYSKS